MTKSLNVKVVCEKHQWPTKDCIMCMSAVYEKEQIADLMQARIAELEQNQCTCNPEDWVATDNSAVIATLEARIAELERVAEWSMSFENIAPQAASSTFKHWEDFVRIQTGLRGALKSAGYLGGGE